MESTSLRKSKLRKLVGGALHPLKKKGLGKRPRWEHVLGLLAAWEPKGRRKWGGREEEEGGGRTEKAEGTPGLPRTETIFIPISHFAICYQ